MDILIALWVIIAGITFLATPVLAEKSGSSFVVLELVGRGFYTFVLILCMISAALRMLRYAKRLDGAFEG
ncbi:MAG: hypothetical protein N3B12_06435 [Armatimonadetes bacterium]|nr:hypothetical protein [Armatimonadota bacterium]